MRSQTAGRDEASLGERRGESCDRAPRRRGPRRGRPSPCARRGRARATARSASRCPGSTGTPASRHRATTTSSSAGETMNCAPAVERLVALARGFGSCLRRLSAPSRRAPRRRAAQRRSGTSPRSLRLHPRRAPPRAVPREAASGDGRDRQARAAGMRVRTRRSSAEPPSVDRQHDPVHVVRRGRREKDRRSGEVGGLAPAACRDALEDRAIPVGVVAQRLCVVGLDVARARSR